MMSADQINPAENDALDASEDARAKEVVAALQTFISSLPPAFQERVRSDFLKSMPQNSRPRDVIATVLRLVPRGREVTVEDVKKSVEAEGVSASAKSIANALAYMHRTNRITRIGHGRYMIDGAELHTADELVAGPPTRNMIDDY